MVCKEEKQNTHLGNYKNQGTDDASLNRVIK